MTAFEWTQAVASVATMVGVAVAAWQLWLTRVQAMTDFEGRLVDRYRAITALLPIEALLGKPLDDVTLVVNLSTFYQYIELTNEQIFLRRRGRIRRSTWLEWLDGIQWNLTRPAFREAWKRIKKESDDIFNELRRLEREGYDRDPRCWFLRDVLRSKTSTVTSDVTPRFHRRRRLRVGKRQQVNDAADDGGRSVHKERDPATEQPTVE